MMLAGLLFLLSLTGGSASNDSVQTDLLDEQQNSNNSFEGSGSASNYSEQPDLLDDPPMSSPNFVHWGITWEEVYHDEQLGSNSSFEDSNCTDREFYKKLNLDKSSMMRPGRLGSPTKVKLDVLIYAILDVNEKDQKFISCLWIDMMWTDKSLTWKPEELCGITNIILPTKEVWTPDLTIEEMTEKDKALPSPYLMVAPDGRVMFRITMVVISTCKMEVYKFPFDFQSCNLSFKSVIHPDSYIQLKEMANSSWTKMWTKKIMQTQSEWLFVDIMTNNKSVDNFGIKQSMVVYTITMKRRSVLYIANFLMPVLFFFFLDLASFLISERGGEKLSFKVTVLLAITVMQLILNEILPSSSDRVPLVAIYCIGMFSLMMISLFETILVMHLMEKDNEADEDQSLSDDSEDTQNKVSFCSYCKELKKWTPCACVCDVSVDEPPSELLSATKESNSSELTEESIALEKLSGEMKEVIQLLNNKDETGKLGYWTRVATTINRVFFISYVTVASVFLTVIFSLWTNKADEKW